MLKLTLGATKGQILQFMVLHGLRLCAAGVALGLAAFLAIRKVLASHLYGVSATDPAALAAAGVLLLVIGTFASYVPVRRALPVDPVDALRAS